MAVLFKLVVSRNVVPVCILLVTGGPIKYGEKLDISTKINYSNKFTRIFFFTAYDIETNA